MAFTIKSFDDIVSDLVAYVVANSPDITDLTPGSVIRSFCEGAGLSLEELYVSTYLGFKRYLDNVQETVFSYERKSGTKASANVVFSRTGSSGDVTIPAGTRVSTASGLTFELSSDATIADGNTDSDPAEVVAEEVGTAYNVSTGTITVMVDTVNGVDSVSNPAAATGGVNVETDHAFKSRFQAYIEGLGKANIAGMKEGALSVEGVTSATVVENFPPVANVNAYLYIDDGSTDGVSTAKVTEVQGIIDGDGTDDNPGYRAGGVNVEVAKPTIVTQNIVMSVTAQAGVDTDQMETDITDVVTQYVNTLGVESDIIFNELVASVMGVFGVTDCTITTPGSNVAITGAQAGRVGTFTITVS